MQLNDQLRKYFSIDMVFKSMHLLSESNSIYFFRILGSNRNGWIKNHG